MIYRTNKTLLDDLEKVYNSIKCVAPNNSICSSCISCKNKHLCFTTFNLKYSLKKFYNEVKNENQEDDTI